MPYGAASDPDLGLPYFTTCIHTYIHVTVFLTPLLFGG